MALAGAVIWDVDHLIPYYHRGILKSPKKFWRAITTEADPYHGQRGWLHNVFAWLLITGVSLLLVPFQFGVAFSLGYLSHLILDALDSADFWPFYPVQKINVRGPIQYFSRGEILLMVFLLFTAWITPSSLF